MIFTDRTIIVQKGTSSINDTIILYRGDKGVEIRFTLNEGSPFRFGSGTSPNIIEKTEAAYGQLIIKRPNDLPAVFSEIAPTNKGKIVFTITAEMIDEITEVGNYTFQIRLLDESRNSRATLPEVVNGIEIREPIATEDITDTNEVGVAAVGYALTTAGTQEDTFDSQGNYNKTTWGTGDRITAAKLNKIEAATDSINKKANNIPTKTSQLENDNDYATITQVNQAIDNAQLGGGEVDLSGYVTKETGNASQITFADGQTFQAKLDAGILKGDKGDRGEQGIRGEKGPKGDKGDPGEPGASNINDTVASATTTYSSNKIESIKEGLNSQIRVIENYSLVKHTDGKVYIKKQDGTLVGTGVAVGGNTDLSKVTMSMDGQTLKLLNDGTQIATVEIPTATVTDEQLTTIIQSKIDDGTLSSLTLQNNSVKKQHIDVLDDTSWNLLDFSTVKYHKVVYLNATSSKNNHITIDIPNIVAGKTYRYPYTGNEGDTDIVFWNSSDSRTGIIATQSSETGYCEVTSPQNSVKARISFNIKNISLSELYFCEPSEYRSPGKISPKWLEKGVTTAELFDELNYRKKKKINKDECTVGMLRTDGTIRTSFKDYYVCDVEVKESTQYTITRTHSSAGNSTVVLLDENKNMLVNIIQENNVAPFTFYTNAIGCKYARICIYIDYINDFWITEGDTFEIVENKNTYLEFGSNVKFPNIYEEQPIKRFKGKTVIVTGDSITSGTGTTTKTWHSYLADWLGFTVYNDGKSGTGLKKSFQADAGLNTRIANNWETTYPTNPDIILLHGFMNDGTDAYALTIGEKTDEKGSDTVYGQTKLALEQLIEKYPLAKIGFICSTPRSQVSTYNWANKGYDSKCYGHGWFEGYIDAYKYVCEEYNIPFLDLYHKSALRPWNVTNGKQYFHEATDDGITNIHPNAEGHLHGIAYPVYEWLKKYF